MIVWMQTSGGDIYDDSDSLYLIYSILRFQIVYHLPTICLPFAYHLSPHHLIVYIPLFFAFVAYSI